MLGADVWKSVLLITGEKVGDFMFNEVCDEHIWQMSMCDEEIGWCESWFTPNVLRFAIYLLHMVAECAYDATELPPPPKKKKKREGKTNRMFESVFVIQHYLAKKLLLPT